MIDDGRLYPLLGERLRKLREERESPKGRMTQAELAALVGMERTSITNIEKGAQKVPLHVLYRICEVLDANVVDVLPSMGEVHRAADSRPEHEVALEFGGRTYQVPPKTMQLISGLLNLETRGDTAQ